MPNKTLASEIQTIIQDEIQQTHNPPQKCTLHKTYDNDPQYADIQTELGILKHIPKIGGNTIGNQGVLIFINNDSEQPFAIIDW